MNPECNRYQHRHDTLRVAFVLVAVLIALLIPVPFLGRIWTAIGDLVHAPMFATLALVWLWIWQRHWPLTEATATEQSSDAAKHQGRRFARRGLVIWVTLTLFGIVMEGIQGMTGRSAAAHDAIANSLGVLAAITATGALMLVQCNRRMIAALCGVFSVAMLGLAWTRSALIMADVIAVHHQFPLLASFESQVELTRWDHRESTARRVAQDVTDGRYALEVEFEATSSPVITLADMVPDWRGMAMLELDATLDANSPGREVMLLIKVIDDSDDGIGAFGKLVRLERGQPQRIQIPLGEFESEKAGDTMDLRKIIYLDIGPLEPGFAATIRLDRLTLAD